MIFLWFLLARWIDFTVAQNFNGEYGWKSDWVKYEMYFGLSIQYDNGTSGNITVDEFESFMDAFITPRFPAGLSWYPVNGQWTGQKGLVRENSIKVVIYASYDNSTDSKVNEIARIYTFLFNQESVLISVITSHVCFEGPAGFCLSESLALNGHTRLEYLANVAFYLSFITFALVVLGSFCIIVVLSKKGKSEFVTTKGLSKT